VTMRQVYGLVGLRKPIAQLEAFVVGQQTAGHDGGTPSPFRFTTKRAVAHMMSDGDTSRIPQHDGVISGGAPASVISGHSWRDRGRRSQFHEPENAGKAVS
jgi:hypothetical protein